MTQPPLIPTSLSPAFALGSLIGSLSCSDLDSALAHFAPEACLLTAAGDVVEGRAAIAVSLRELIEDELAVCVDAVDVIEAGDLATASLRWSLRDLAKGGVPARQADASAVLRRIELNWRLAIFAPWGERGQTIPAPIPGMAVPRNGAHVSSLPIFPGS